MENKKEFIINLLYYALIIGLVYLFCNYILGVISPFIIGFIFAYIAVKISKKLFKKDTKIIRSLSLILVYLILVGLLALLAVLGINELIEFIAKLPNLYKSYVEPILNNLGNSDINSNLPIEIQGDVKEIYANIMNSIKSLISSFSSFIVSKATEFISNTTSLFVSVLVTLISSFFFVCDYENIVSYLVSLMNNKVKTIYLNVSDFLVNTVFLVIKSYGLIMSITFVELLIGLFILRIENFGLVALVTAFLDILPVLGVGTVLIPWAIYELIVGKTALCIGLAILYIFITIIRNIIEPKIVGGNLGLHPLAALFSMIVGLQLFGIVGLFGFPLLLSYFVKNDKKQNNEIETNN